METRAHHLIVGLFVLVFAVAMVVFTLWAAGLQIFETRQSFVVYFDGSVTGLREGRPVRFHGIPVGKVERVEIDPANMERIRVLIRVNEGTPVKIDSYASLATKGVTGNAFVLIEGGTHEAPMLRAAAGEIPEIPSRVGPVDQLLEDAPKLLSTLMGVADRLERVLSPGNEERITGAVANLHRMSVDLAAAADDAVATMGSVRATAETVEAMAVDVRRDAKTVTGDLSETLVQLRRTLTSVQTHSAAWLDEINTTGGRVRTLADSMRHLSDEFAALMAESRVPIRDFTNVGLYELSRLLIELRHLSVSLGRMSEEIQRGPVTFLFTGAQEDKEAPQ